MQYLRMQTAGNTQEQQDQIRLFWNACPVLEQYSLVDETKINLLMEREEYGKRKEGGISQSISGKHGGLGRGRLPVEPGHK